MKKGMVSLIIILLAIQVFYLNNPSNAASGPGGNPVIQDLTPPIITLNNPIDLGDNFVELPLNSQLYFTCSATDNLELNKVEFWDTSLGGFSPKETKFITGPNATVVFTKSFSQEGAYSWNCKFFDASGNSQFGNVNGQSPGFKIKQDILSPTVNLISPVDLNDNVVELSADYPITFTCSASDDLYLSKVDLWLTTPSQPFGAVETKIINGQNDIATFTKSFSQEGNYAWNCKFFDLSGKTKFGNINSLSPGFIIKKDTLSPIVNLISPSNQQNYNINTNVNFVCSATDNTGLSKVELWVSSPSGGFTSATETKFINGLGDIVTFTKSFSQGGIYSWNCKFFDLNNNHNWGYINGRSPTFTLQSQSCSPGSLKDGTQCLTCDSQGNNYIQDETKCNPGFSCNVDGTCFTQCISECDIGDNRCYGNGYQTCEITQQNNVVDLKSNQVSQIACYKWSATSFCSQNEFCSDGNCVPRKNCNSECNLNDRRCKDGGYQICQDNNNDGCYEWGENKICTQSQTCSNGFCSSQTIGYCIDGTLYNNCSEDKPKFCQNGVLLNDCKQCGCNNNGVCLKDGSCISQIEYKRLNDISLLKKSPSLIKNPEFIVIQGESLIINLNEYVVDPQNMVLVTSFEDATASYISNSLDCNLINNVVECKTIKNGSEIVNVIASNGIKKIEFPLDIKILKRQTISQEEEIDHSPKANAGLDITSLTGSYFILDGSGSYDPDGDLLKDSFKWYENEEEIGSGKNLRLKYDSIGSHKIKLKVIDPIGLISEDEMLVNVINKDKCKNTNTKYYPQDTICNSKWPSSDGNTITINSKDYSCNLVEVCDESIDYIIEDSINCCSGNVLVNSKAIGACNFANKYSNENAKKCQALYLIKSLGASQIYMQDYFEAEMCCRGVDGICSNKDYLYTSNPIPNTEENLDSLKCYNSPYNNPPGEWVSDINLGENNIALSDLPSHASLNEISTGTCVDYSFSLTTLLRKAGYLKNEIISVESSNHAYNLIKLPLDKKYTIFDTTGNNEPPIILGKVPYGYKYCEEIKNCYNDNGKVSCPKVSEINGCEKIRLSFWKESRLVSLEIKQKIQNILKTFIEGVQE